MASVIAGLGLVSNSTATIIASMLVSPIMGPVVAIAYGKLDTYNNVREEFESLTIMHYYRFSFCPGSTIYDRKMMRMAWTNELVSLIVCVIVGVIIGACTGWGKSLDRTLVTQHVLV